MKEFTSLLEIADQLLGPKGCSWDKEQTFFTLQKYVLEETHELLEAIDSQDSEKIADELGDVLYSLIFIAKLGEIQNKFTIKQSLEMVAEKLIRRHPHVFGDAQVSSTQDIINNWEKIKQKEKGTGGIPSSLPAMVRAQKMIHKMKLQEKENLTEEQVGQMLWDVIRRAELSGIDAESALRRTLQKVVN